MRHTRRWRLAAVLLAALACAEREPDPVPAFGRVLPETRGAIASVVLSLSSARRSTLRNAELVTRIVDALPAETRVRLLTSDPGAFALRAPSVPHRLRDIELVPVEGDRALTIWPQDPFLVLEGADGRTRLLRSRRFERADDAVMAEAIAVAEGYEVVESELAFEGGNLAADETRVFVGANTIRANALELGLSEAAVARRFEAALGRPVVVVGPVPQWIAHLDMFLIPLGGDRVMLADPGAGAEIAGEVLARDPEQIRDFERETERWFFGAPEIERLEGGDGSIERPDLGGATARAIRDSAALAAGFDALARALTARGLDVLRAPILLTRVGGGGRAAEAGPAGSGDGTPASERPYAAPLDFPILTYTNVLQERRDGRSRVWLPQYGLGPLDAAARAAWRDAGLQVEPIEGFATSALYGGALRCAVKVLERGP